MVAGWQPSQTRSRLDKDVSRSRAPFPYTHFLLTVDEEDHEREGVTEEEFEDGPEPQAWSADEVEDTTVAGQHANRLQCRTRLTW